jgi:hypothetical protein
MTLQCLLIFGNYCPDLVELSLFLRVSEVPTLRAGTRIMTSLRYLDFGKSVLVNVKPDTVGEFLWHLCPSLQELSSAEADPSEGGLWWETLEMGQTRSSDWQLVRKAYKQARNGADQIS